MAKQLVGKYWHDFDCPKSSSNIARCENYPGCEPQRVVTKIIYKNEDFQWDNRIRESEKGRASNLYLLCLDCMNKRKVSCFFRDNSTRSGYRTVCIDCMKREDEDNKLLEMEAEVEKEGFVVPEDALDIIQLKLINQLPATRKKYFRHAQVIVWNAKLCSGCDKVKFVSGFYPGKGMSSGLDSQCKVCRKATQKSLRENAVPASAPQHESSD